MCSPAISFSLYYCCDAIVRMRSAAMLSYAGVSIDEYSIELKALSSLFSCILFAVRRQEHGMHFNMSYNASNALLADDCTLCLCTQFSAAILEVYTNVLKSENLSMFTPSMRLSATAMSPVLNVLHTVHSPHLFQDLLEWSQVMQLLNAAGQEIKISTGLIVRDTFHGFVLLLYRMLQDLPDELAFKIISYLPTKDRLRLSIINHAWRDLCQNNHNWAEITIKTNAKQVEGALDWLADLDERSDPTVKTLKMDIWRFDPEQRVAPESESQTY